MSPRHPHRWVEDQAAFEAAIDALVGVDSYAIDTEFHRERTYFPTLALVQIAWDDELLLVDPGAAGVSIGIQAPTTFGPSQRRRMTRR